MKAAIYARKSTDDNDKNADNKSVTRQVERARAYAQAKGWTVDDAHIYIDDGISGADFEKRRSFHRLQEAAARGAFEVVVASEPSRLGRSGLADVQRLTDILESGVRVFYYLDDKEEKCDTFEGELNLVMQGLFSKQERLRASQRSRDACARKAEAGYNAGGRVYGYNNHQVLTTNARGDQTRSHTEYRINDAEAEVIRRIFQMYMDGYGLDRIAKTLNGDPRYRDLTARYFAGQCPPAPVHGKRGSGSWAATSLHGILRRERYTGLIPYGEYRKVLRKGKKKREKTGNGPKLIAAPHLRIVSQELWDQVQARVKDAQQAYIKRTGGHWRTRPDTGRESKYLLAGLVRCECCGASMIASSFVSGHPGKRQSIRCYVCSYYSNRGSTVCSNRQRPRMPLVDNDVITAIEQTVLTPSVTHAIIEGAYCRARELARAQPDTSKHLRAELARAERELQRYVALIATSNAAPAVLLAEVQKREERVTALRQELATHDESMDLTELDMRRLRKEVENCMGRFKNTLHADIPGARAALRQLLVGPIWYAHGGDGSYTLRGETRVGALLPETSVKMASPRECPGWGILRAESIVRGLVGKVA